MNFNIIIIIMVVISTLFAYALQLAKLQVLVPVCWHYWMNLQIILIPLLPLPTLPAWMSRILHLLSEITSRIYGNYYHRTISIMFKTITPHLMIHVSRKRQRKSCGDLCTCIRIYEGVINGIAQGETTARNSTVVWACSKEQNYFWKKDSYT